MLRVAHKSSAQLVPMTLTFATPNKDSFLLGKMSSINPFLLLILPSVCPIYPRAATCPIYPTLSYLQPSSCLCICPFDLQDLLAMQNVI